MNDPINGDKPHKLQWSRYHSAFISMPVRPGLWERLKASCGAVGGIALTAVLCGLLLGSGVAHPLLVAPMGASAVLLFAVPASPLAQPWSIMGGNVVSAFVGVAVARLIPDMTIAAAVAVGVAIAAMSALKCLHPPGGAVALTAVMGGSAVTASGYMFPLVPVGVNSLLLLAAAYAYHRFSGHSYPHVPAASAPNVHGTADIPPGERAGVTPDDIESALEGYGDELDVSPEDLRALFRDVEVRAVERLSGVMRCADIMSRDIVTVRPGANIAEARALMMSRNLQSMPVLNDQGQVKGMIGHLELGRGGDDVGEVMSPALLAQPETPVADLLKPLSQGLRHEVLIVDQHDVLMGMITQTDMLAALAAVLPAIAPDEAHAPEPALLP